MRPRMAWLVFWLAIVLLIGVPVLSQARTAHIVCDDDLCATTRETMMMIVREIERLRGLVGKECT